MPPNARSHSAVPTSCGDGISPPGCSAVPTHHSTSSTTGTTIRSSGVTSMRAGAASDRQGLCLDRFAHTAS